MPDDPDKRTYNVDFSKINRVLGFQATVRPMKASWKSSRHWSGGMIDYTIRNPNRGIYRYLLDAQKVLNESAWTERMF